MGTNDLPAPWGPAKRVLFRFLFAYLVLYILPFPLDLTPYDEAAVGKIVQPYRDLWDALVPWVGQHVFGVEITVRPNGSGDTTYNYVQVFCFLVLAAAAAAAWTALDRRRPGYPRLYEWLRVYVRFDLATTMIAYGAVKVIKSQFPNPSLDRLVQPFGDASPMGLLWTFMGASASYNVFSGAGEMLGGLLLTARRTTLLGALVCLGVLGNVVLLNFSYDVPVKLFSCHLLAMAVFLAAPDLRRLANFFLLNRPVGPAQLAPLLRRKWLHRAALVLRTVAVLAFVGLALAKAQEVRKTYGDLRPRPPLYGIWNVEEFTIDGEVRPPVVTDPTRWRRVIFDYPQVLAVQLMSDSRQRYLLKLDADEHTLALSRRDDPDWKAMLTFSEPGPGRLVLEGTFQGRAVRAQLRRSDESEFLLVNRGFHWINEYPFNR
jgi:hypothetical protein